MEPTRFAPASPPTAFDNGVPEFKIRQQRGHKTSRMLEKYIRSEQKARQEAALSLGL